VPAGMVLRDRLESVGLLRAGVAVWSDWVMDASAGVGTHMARGADDTPELRNTVTFSTTRIQLFSDES